MFQFITVSVFDVVFYTASELPIFTVISAYHSPALTHITTHTLVHFRRKPVEICIFCFELVVVHPFHEQHFVLHRNFRMTTIPLIAEIFRTGTVIGQHANRLACLCTKTYDVVFYAIDFQRT